MFIFYIGDSMKKRLKIFVMCFVLLAMSLFTGCSLVETNNSKLYNDVVAEIYNDAGKRVATVTNRELLSGYESYGKSYVQYNNYSVKDAVNMTLRQLENRKITIMTAEDIFGINYKTGEGLSELEKTYLYQQTIDSLNENLKSYMDSADEETADENEEIKFNGYDKNVTLEFDEHGQYYIKKVDKNNGLLEDFRPTVQKSYYNAEDKAEIYTNFIDSTLASEEHERALKLYIVDLQSAEYGLGYKDNRTKAMFEREIERLYKIHYENYIIEKYSDHNKLDSDISPVTTDEILNLYSSKVRSSYAQYAIEKDSGYNEDVSGSVNDVYYFKNDADTKYFTVANILFKFDENQEKTYNDIQKKLESSDIYDSYESDMNALYASLKPVVRTYNEATDSYEGGKVDNASVDDIIEQKIKVALKAAQSTNDVNVIGDTINDLIYSYNEDPGMFNAAANYVIGVDSEGKAVSSFVEEFNNAGLELYNNGRGEIGDVAIARSSFGIHVLVYTGQCKNLFDGIDENFNLVSVDTDAVGKNAIEVLYSTRVNLLVDKTYFDLMYDEIYKDNFSYFEKANMNFLREKYEFKVYSKRMADSLKG